MIEQEAAWWQGKAMAYKEKVERLEKEASWLALQLSKMGNTVPFCCPDNKPYRPIEICLHEEKSCTDCWRDAARKYVEEQCQNKN